MAEFETKCPHCGAELNVQDDWIGMNVECPQCKKEFTIRKDPVSNPKTDAPIDANRESLPPEPSNSALSPYKKVPFGTKDIVLIIVIIATCSGLISVGFDNFHFDSVRAQRRIKKYHADMNEPLSVSPINFTIDQICSFLVGFFFLQDYFLNGSTSRMLLKVLFRYGQGEALRNAVLKNMEVWEMAKEQQKRNSYY